MSDKFITCTCSRTTPNSKYVTGETSGGGSLSGILATRKRIRMVYVTHNMGGSKVTKACPDIHLKMLG